MRDEQAGRVADRPDLTPDQSTTAVYATSGLPKEPVVATLRFVAAAVDIPDSRLRPADRFTEELSAVKGREFDQGNIATLDDHIRRRVSLEVAVRRRG